MMNADQAEFCSSWHLDLQEIKLDQKFAYSKSNIIGKCLVYIYLFIYNLKKNKYHRKCNACVYVLQLDLNHCATHAEPMFCVCGVGE